MANSDETRPGGWETLLWMWHVLFWGSMIQIWLYGAYRTFEWVKTLPIH